MDQEALTPRQRLVVKALLGALAQGKLELPMLPDQAARALEVASNPVAEFAAYEAAIRPNAAMTAQVLRAANSPLYGASREVTSVKQAMLMLGTSALSQLVMQAVVQMQKFGDAASAEFVEAEHRHALAVAHLMPSFADVAGLGPGEAFLCGLLHDLGRLLFPELARARSMNLAEDQSTILCQELHPALGYRVCVAWNLPGIVLEAVSRHHAHEAKGARRYSKVGHAVAAAEAAIIAHGMGGSEGHLHGDCARETFERLGSELGLGADQLTEIDEKARGVAERMAG